MCLVYVVLLWCVGLGLWDSLHYAYNILLVNTDVSDELGLKNKIMEIKKSKNKSEEHVMHTCNVSLLSLVMPAFSFKPYTSGEDSTGRFWIKHMAPSWSLSSGI